MSRLRFSGMVTLMLVGSTEARAADTLMPRIVHEACPEYEKGKPFVILARFEDESQLFDPKVIYRTLTGSYWKHAPFAKEAGSENFVATIKAQDLRGPLEYFVEVFDEYGNGPARMGSPDAPIKVMPARLPAPCQQIPEKVTMTVTQGSAVASGPTSPPQQPPPPVSICDSEDRPLYCEAWLWGTVGGVVLAGVGTAVYFLAIANGEEPPTEKSIKLVISGPDPTQSPLTRGR